MRNVVFMLQFYRRNILKLIFRTIMAEKRKSAFKHPCRHRRNRSSTPTIDLLSPYLPGPELFISLPMSLVQTRPAFSSARFDSSLNSVSSLLTGSVPSSGSMSSPNSTPMSSNSGSMQSEPHTVQDLSIRSSAQSAFPPKINWC